MIGRRKNGSAASYGYMDSTAPTSAGTDAEMRRRPSVPKAPHRAKTLAGVAAVSVAVALFSAAYGTWAALSAQATVDAAQADTQPALVAATSVRAGDVLEKSSFETKAVPRSLLAQGVYAPEVFEGEASPVGKRALVDIPQGAQITPAVVAGSMGGGYLAAALSPGMQAVTIAVDAEAGLAGQLRPSDRVRVVALDGSAAGEALLATICEDVRVAALDGAMEGGGGGYSSVTIEVSAVQADAVRAAQHAGKVSLVLLPVLKADGTLASGLSTTAPVPEEATDEGKEAPRG